MIDDVLDEVIELVICELEVEVLLSLEETEESPLEVMLFDTSDDELELLDILAVDELLDDPDTDLVGIDVLLADELILGLNVLTEVTVCVLKAVPVLDELEEPV